MSYESLNFAKIAIYLEATNCVSHKYDYDVIRRKHKLALFR